MGETNEQPPPPPVAAPPPMMAMMVPPVGAGAIHPPHEQFHHLNYCVHSNPSWGKGMSRGTLTCFLLVFVLD